MYEVLRPLCFALAAGTKGRVGKVRYRSEFKGTWEHIYGVTALHVGLADSSQYKTPPRISLLLL